MADVENINNSASETEIQDDVNTTMTENESGKGAKDKAYYDPRKAGLESQKSKTVADKIINMIVETLIGFVRDRDALTTRNSMRGLLATIMAINEADEFETALHIDGERYFFEEYLMPGCMADLVVAKKVVVRDVGSAVDFLDRARYNTTYKPLTPSDFARALKQLGCNLRVNSWLDVKKVDRASHALLVAAASLAVTDKKVESRSQSAIYFLNATFDKNADTSIDEWCKRFAVTIANNSHNSADKKEA